jgi:putative FmdB family regulatory protein
MPIYEYVCSECNHPFEALILGSETADCPECGSEKLEKQLSVFAVNDEPAAPPPNPCAGCPQGDGPGACGMMG